ncbi:unnamed protein product [Polarella glacialis]|uniref:Uncharacterized protein n=1 Tax=Polarella glacialis TaxID=89957 RepID=A0A813GME7_POLGL|nr:unnamed protein product [Polarella glacialis]CAE8646554.1 unnamed protein product [Polarella glacialis]
MSDARICLVFAAACREAESPRRQHGYSKAHICKRCRCTLPFLKVDLQGTVLKSSFKGELLSGRSAFNEIYFQRQFRMQLQHSTFSEIYFLRKVQFPQTSQNSPPTSPSSLQLLMRSTFIEIYFQGQFRFQLPAIYFQGELLSRRSIINEIYFYGRFQVQLPASHFSGDLVLSNLLSRI